VTERSIPTGTSEHGSLLRQALRSVEQMKQKLNVAESRGQQPIAIIGMGCRFPGDVNDTASFWELLRSGQEAITEVPAERWKIDDYYDPDSTKPGKMVSRFGGFLKDIDLFDAAFFGIAPREAAMMDPQQRILLEVTWQALESGGIAPRSLAGSKTGMYLGIASGDYAQMQLHAGDAELLDVHFASGNSHSIASGRLSYLLGLKGPSLSIDTACSSSLVAVHVACQALRAGECNMAIAAGVNIILAPETTVALSQAHMLSPDGRSKTFDDRADGFARAEGCGVVVLKPLDQAEKDGDRIHAVIRGTALNQDGASSSLTAPNGPSQEELMRSAILNAGRSAAQIGYVEAHGTGTSLGDPIELRALGTIYGASRKPDNPLYVGSLKTNFGHMEAAAGIGGLIKLVLALQHGEIPAHLQIETPTTHVNWKQLSLAVSRTTIPWPRSMEDDRKMTLRMGAVSSFGFSGTNAHVIVEQAPPESNFEPTQSDGTAELVLLSARSEPALRELTSEYKNWLSSPQADNYTLAEIAATAAQGRDHFRHRASFVSRSKAEAFASLNHLLSGKEIEMSSASPSLCFLFTGQGSERSGMGVELFEKNAAFRSAIERLDTSLNGSLGQSIASIWTNANRELGHAGLMQPALYAYGWALSELWRHWGVEPQVVLGHSLGEYVAATVAGVMTPEEGICLVAARGRLTEKLGQPGGMVAIVASERDVQRYLREKDGLSLAAVNGPASVVLSGGIVAIEKLEGELSKTGLRYKRLRTTHGFHSAALEPMLDAFEAEAAKIRFRVPEVRWISNLTGNVIERKQPVDARYWRRHLRETVQFERGLAAAQGAGVFLEVGAEPQLLALAEANEIANDRLISSVSKSRTGGEGYDLLSAASRLYTIGVDLDWKSLNQGGPFRRVPLPGYPFQRQRFWFDQVSRRMSSQKPTVTLMDRMQNKHPLLGSRLRTRSGMATFHAELSPQHPDHLGDHVVMGRRILPGAAYLEIAIAAACSIDAGNEWIATDVEFREPCVFDEPLLLETALHQVDANGRRRFEIASTPAGAESAWTVHAIGFVEPAKLEPADNRRIDRSTDRLALQNQALVTWDKAAFYRRFVESGLNFGPAFQPVIRAWGNAEESLIEMQPISEVQADGDKYILHPVLLDACLQAAAALVRDEQINAPALPAAVAGYRLFGYGASLRYARAVVRRRQGRGLTVHIDGLDADGRIVLAVESLTLVETAHEKYAGWLHEVVWERLALNGNGGLTVKSERVDLDATAWHQDLMSRASVNGLGKFDRWMREFDALCAAWIAEEMERGGFQLAAGRVFNLPELIAALRIAPEHRRLAGRFLEILGEFEYLQSESDGRYRSLGRPHADTETESRRLAESGYPEIAWAQRTAGKLLPLLRGEVSAVEVLFAESGQQIATRLYRESVVSRIFNPALVFAAKQVVSSLGYKARVLEVGGGTAATTSYLVPALTGEIGEYLWTDIGSGFVSAARREFGHLPAMRFQTLDLERDLLTQNLSEESFDIVVASNVIHATADLRQTLRHIRSLLRSGGVLLLAETVGKQPWIDMTVGFTEGWWCFSDHDLRADYPLISRSAWSDLLRECGFDEVAVTPSEAESQRGTTLGKQCLITAIAADKKGVDSAIEATAAKLLIVTLGAKEEPELLASGLQKLAQASGVAVTIVSSAEVSPKLIEEWFGTDLPDAHSPREKADIFYMPGAQLTDASRERAQLRPMEWQEQVLGGALRLAKALLATDRQSDCRLWLVSRGAAGPEIDAPDGATLAAFARSVNAEYEEAHAIAVDLSSGNSGARELWSLCQSTAPKEMQYALRGADVWVPHLEPRALQKTNTAQARRSSLKESETRRLYLSGTGLLEDLKPRLDERRAPASGEVEIAITAVAVNFHEVLSALDDSDDAARHGDIAPGGECTGVVVRVGEGVADLHVGDEIVAIGWGLMADFATLIRNRIWKRPPNINAEDAATLPIPFLTARWSLQHVAKLQPGERVLIHAAAGGVGLAAVQEAQQLGAIVFATAGSEAKREYLRSLGVDAVFDSRSTAFEQGVMEATRFQGVDVVLNSLAGDKIAVGMRTLAPRGRFIELGEKTVLTDAEAEALRPDVTYQRVHLRAALAAASPEVCAVIASVLKDAERGEVRPLPWKRFALSQAAEAFRHIASGQHTGRVLLVPTLARGDELRDRAGRFSGFRRDGAYVVTGAFKGLGLLVVEWLAQQGAGYVLALGRNEPTPKARAKFARLNDEVINVVSVRCDVSDEGSLGDALQVVPSQFALRGVFHCAGVLDDAGLPQQTYGRFRSVLSPKVAGGWNLHRLTLSARLDCFVLFSSAAGMFGSRGQSNHSAANAYLDALAHFRREQLGLPALSVNWGVWSEAGAAVGHDVVRRSEDAGVSSIPTADGLRLLGQLLEEGAIQMLVSRVDWRKFAKTSKAEATANADLLSHVLRARTASDHKGSQVAQSTAPANKDGMGAWRDKLLAVPGARRRLMLEERVEERIRSVLSLPESQSIDSMRPLQEYGLDSLLSIELRNALSADLDAKLSATALFDYPTLAALTDWLLRDVLKLQVEEISHTEVAQPMSQAHVREHVQDVLEEVAALSDDEVERMFQEKMAGMRK